MKKKETGEKEGDAAVLWLRTMVHKDQNSGSRTVTITMSESLTMEEATRFAAILRRRRSPRRLLHASGVKMAGHVHNSALPAGTTKRKATLSLRGRCLLAAVREANADYRRLKVPADAFRDLFARVTLIDRTFAGYAAEVPHGTCRCCGMDLTDPVSIERGIGPKCHGNERRLKAALAKLMAQ